VDPYAESFASLNPYNSMGNNPISIVDPNGDFIGNVVGAAVGVTVNGIGNTIKGDPFFQGWVGAAIAGAVSGGGSAAGSIGSQVASGAASGAISGINGHLPSIGVNVGDFSLSLSPALMMGDAGFGVGANLSASVDSKLGSFGVGLGGTQWSKHSISGKSFFETRVSHGIAIGPRAFRVGLGSATFTGGGFPQTTGSVSISGNGWGIDYENDFLFNIDGLADRADRWRTGAFRISAGDFSVGLNVFTGDPGSPLWKRIDEARPDYPGGQSYFKNGADNYRAGVLTIGYKNYRIGINSENVRAGFQNTIHTLKHNTPHFRNMGIPTSIYGSYQTKNPYTLW